MRRLERELKLLEVAIYRHRGPTYAERLNGMARRYMTDAAYWRQINGARTLQEEDG